MELQFDVSEENKKEQSIPSAPLEPNIEIRTMKSDVAALKESGGYVTNISGESASAAVSRPAVSEQPIFVGNQNVSENKSSVVKMVLIIIALLILAAVVGFASYYLAVRILK